MTSDTDLVELEKRLDVSGNERKERDWRVSWAIAAVILSGTIMAVGIYIIGEAQGVHSESDKAYSYWITPQFEIGIFITLIGTVSMVLAANFFIRILEDLKSSKKRRV